MSRIRVLAERWVSGFFLLGSVGVTPAGRQVVDPSMRVGLSRVHAESLDVSFWFFGAPQLIHHSADVKPATWAHFRVVIDAIGEYQIPVLLAIGHLSTLGLLLVKVH